MKRQIVRRALDSILGDLPPMCFATRPGDDTTLVALKRGEAGYHLASEAGEKGLRIRQTLVGLGANPNDPALLNEALGISPAQVLAMINGSLFGFDCPGADPLNCARAEPDLVFVSTDRRRGGPRT